MSKIASMDNNLPPLSLKDVFNETAARAVRDFPERFDNLYLTLLTDSIYISPIAAKLLRDNTTLVKSEIERAIQYLRDRGAAGLAHRIQIPEKKSDGHIGWKNFNLILIAKNEKTFINEQRIYVSEKFSSTIDLIGILDHEIGHHVVEEGRSEKVSAHMEECAADAYAALRHIQRFGDSTDFFEHAQFTRARIIVHGRSSIHYTSTVIQKIDKLRKEIDISALTHQETAALAGKITQEYSLNEKTLQKIEWAFQPLKLYLAQNNIDRAEFFKIQPENNIGYFKTLVDIMHKNKNHHDIYRAGRLIMSKYMDAIKREAKKDPFWNEALVFMERYEKESGIILNLAAAMDAARQLTPLPAAAPTPR